MFNQTSIPTLGGASTIANGIGPNGEVVGWSHNPSGTRRAYLFESGAISDLGEVPMLVPPIFAGLTFVETEAFAVSVQFGEVIAAGTTRLLTKSNVPPPMTGNSLINDRATLFRKHSNGFISATDLGTLAMVGAVSFGGSAAFGINSAGMVVGAADTGIPNQRHAFLFDPNTTSSMTSLGTLDFNSSTGMFVGNSEALAINDSGQIVGVSDTADLDSAGKRIRRAFVFDIANNQMSDLGTLIDWVQPPETNLTSEARSINNAGQIVGKSSSIEATGTRVTRAFMFDPSIVGGRFMWDIGTLMPKNRFGTFRDVGNSEAYGINDSGAFVGMADVGVTPREWHAFRRELTIGAEPIDVHGEMIINPGNVAVQASAINNQGQIIVNLTGATSSASLLTP